LFEAQFQEDGKDWQATTPNLTGVTSVDILNIVPGVYNFRVRAQDTSGLFRSEWTNLSSQTLLGKKKAPENVSDFTATVEKFGILLKWTPISDIDIDFYEIRSGVSWAAGTPIGKPKAAEFKYEDATTGAYTFWIAAKDTSDNYSATPATIGATISAQSTPTLTAVAVNGGIQLTIAGTTTRGFKAYEIQRKEYPSGTLTTINDNVLTKIFTDSDITTLTYAKEWQYQVRALDQNGSASAYSIITTQITPKQIENNDITANQIIAKDFRTALNAGNGTVSGVLFNANGIQAWNGATNTFCINACTGDVSMTGTITANCGFIGGWTVTCDCLAKTVITGTVAMSSTESTIYSHRADSAYGEWHGQIYNNGWTGRYGFAVTRGIGNYVFRSDTDINGANACNQIAGWNFDNYKISGQSCAGIGSGWAVTTLRSNHASCCTGEGLYVFKSNLIHVSTGMVYDPACYWCCNRYGIGVMVGNGTAWTNNIFEVSTDGSDLRAQIAGWCFDNKMLKTGVFGCGVSFMMSKENSGAGYFYLGEQTLQGYSMIWHHGSNAGHLVMGQIAANVGTIKTDYYGLQMMDHAGNEFFALAAKQGFACYAPYNRIAGWWFDATHIYSNNLGIYASGSIQTLDFVAGNKGWKIGCNGNAEFNDICARGAIRTAVFNPKSFVWIRNRNRRPAARIPRIHMQLFFLSITSVLLNITNNGKRYLC